MVDVLPSMMLLGFGAGMAFNPVLLAAMSDVEPDESGLASGVVNTSFMMGGALGLAVLASLAAARTDTLAATAAAQASRRSPAATTRRSWSARCFALAAAAIGGLFLTAEVREGAGEAHGAHAEPEAA